MNSFPNSAKLVKGGLVILDAKSSRVRRVISLQYNPEQLTRSLAHRDAPPEPRSIGSIDAAEMLRERLVMARAGCQDVSDY